MTALASTDRRSARECSPAVVRRGRLGIQVSLLSAAVGFQFAQGFTAGNVCQLVALWLMLPATTLLSPGDWLKLLAIWGGIVVSTVPLALSAHVEPQWFQVVFFCLCALQVALAIRLAPHLDLRATIRTPTNLAALILVATAGIQFATNAVPIYDLYFDDKSHAAVSTYCLAFLVLWVNQRVGRFFLALAVLAAGILTASRLVFLGVPILGIAALIEYRRSRKAALTPISVYLHHLVLLTVPLLAVALGGSTLAKGLADRLSSDDATAGNSTMAHIELARLAGELKFADPLIAALGVGPGGFSAGLRVEGIYAGRLAVYDPSAYLVLITDFAPIHSATITMLVEYPVWVSGAFVALWWSILRRLWRQRERTLFTMAAGMLTVTSFYSTHNEFLYTAFLMVLSLAAFRSSRCEGRQTPSAQQSTRRPGSGAPRGRRPASPPMAGPSVRRSSSGSRSTS